MKNAILLHGSSSTPNHFWLPSIKKFLEERDYSVWAPQLPVPEAPNLEYQLPFVLENGTFNSETIMVGHSSGCPLILAVLEKINVRIKKAVLVAGFGRPLHKMTDPVLKKYEGALRIAKEEYDWKKIKNNVEEIIFINSDNDPWGCNDEEGRYMQKHLGGKLIVNHEGHMGSEMKNQPYREFSLLEKLLS